MSHLGTVRVAGPGSFDALQSTLTNDLRKIAPGRAQYTHLLDRGRLRRRRHHRVVGRRGVASTSCPTRRTPPGCSARSPGEDVTGGRSVLAVQGPAARERVAAVDAAMARVGRFAVATIEYRGRRGARRGHRLHRRGRRRDRDAQRGRRRALRRPPGRGGRAGRARRARHAAPGGRPAAATATSSARRPRPSRPASAGSSAGTRRPSAGRAAVEPSAAAARVAPATRVRHRRAPAAARRAPCVAVDGRGRGRRSPRATSRRSSSAASASGCWRGGPAAGRRGQRRAARPVGRGALSPRCPSWQGGAEVADYLPHTDDEVAAMLAFLGLGVARRAVRHGARRGAPRRRARPRRRAGPSPTSSPSFDALGAPTGPSAATSICFAGAGAYDHEVPAVVRALASRSEFVTAYTPYQPEVAQGVLQAVFEYQTMVARLAGLPDRQRVALRRRDRAGRGAQPGRTARRARQRVLVSAGRAPALARGGARRSRAGTGHQIVEVPAARRRHGLGERRRRRRRRRRGRGLPELARRASRTSRRHAPRADAAGALLVVARRPGRRGRAAHRGRRGAPTSSSARARPSGRALSFGGPYLGLFACTRRPGAPPARPARRRDGRRRGPPRAT